MKREYIPHTCFLNSPGSHSSSIARILDLFRFQRRRFNWPQTPTSLTWKEHNKTESPHKRERTSEESAPWGGSLTSRGRSDSKSGNGKSQASVPWQQDVRVENGESREEGLVCVRAFRVFPVHKAASSE